MIDALHNKSEASRKTGMLKKLIAGPLVVCGVVIGLLCVCGQIQAAISLAKGSGAVIAAQGVSAFFYMRGSALRPGFMLARLIIALVVKWAVLLTCAYMALTQGGVVVAAYIGGLILALMASLFGFGFTDSGNG